MNLSSILIVEDDFSLREALSDTLTLSGYKVIGADSGVDALDKLSKEKVDIVVSDVQMSPMDGHLLLKKIKTKYPDLPVILTTAYGAINKAVEAMRDGAVDYLVKPFEAQVLLNLVSRFAVSNEAAPDLVAVDPRSKAIADLARRVAATDVTVMISGESGTGKEVYARFIHNHSPRAKGPFIAINCAAIPENMLEAILFGYEKGAFTGAYRSTPGKFEQAHGGTLLLDEISEMDLGLQAKLLRVIQEREVERLGGEKLIALDVRVLATTNRNLKAEVAAGRFREDLFYRLNVFPIHLSPLRERPEDILALANKLIERHTAPGQLAPVLAVEACNRLLGHQWLGNVRELDNVIQRAFILMANNIIDVTAIHFEVEDPPVVTALTMENIDLNSLEDDLKTHEQRLIIDALKAENGNRKMAAEKLGISPRTLRYKLARLRDAGVAIP